MISQRTILDRETINDSSFSEVLDFYLEARDHLVRFPYLNHHNDYRDYVFNLRARMNQLAPMPVA